MTELERINDALQSLVSHRGNELPSDVIHLLSDLDWCVRNGGDSTKRTEPPLPGIRRPPAQAGTITREHYESLERLGASPDFLAKLRPIVRDDDEPPEL